MTMSDPFISASYLRMPDVEKGMTVGLFGGSFNPPHEGHVMVAELALQRLELDQVWWMVSPGNPLKDKSNLAPLQKRIELSDCMINDPRIKVTAFEAAFNLHYSIDTIRYVKKHNKKVSFVWIIGADSLNSFHQWDRWRDIAEEIPIAVIDRPNWSLAPMISKAAQVLSRWRINESDANQIAKKPAPAWTFIHGPRISISSTELREVAASKK